VAVRAAAAVRERYVLPSYRPDKRHVGELYQVVVARAGVEGDVCWRVRLVLLVVDVEPDGADLYAPEEVDGE
jgi:hypothetical protein